MLIRLPFFRLDEAVSGWDDVFTAEQPVNDDQPNEESETTEEEPEAEEQDVVEPDSDDAEPSDEDADDEPDDEEDDSADESDEQPTFNDETEIDMGEGRQPVKLAELKQGYLRQSDYTKKTQELATQRKALETEQETLKPTREWFEYMQANPYLFNQLNKAIDQWEGTGALPLEEVMENPEAARYINHFMAETSRLQKELDDARGKLGEVEFTTGMDKLVGELKSEYGDLLTSEYEDTLRQRAKEQGLSTDVLKEIADGHLSKQKLLQEQSKAKKTKRETEAKTIQRLQEQRESLPPQPKRKGQAPSTEKTARPDVPMGWDDIF